MIRTLKRTQERRVIECWSKVLATATNKYWTPYSFFAELRKVFRAFSFSPDRKYSYLSVVCERLQVWKTTRTVFTSNTDAKIWHVPRQRAHSESYAFASAFFFCYAKLNIQSALEMGSFLCIKHERNGLLRRFSFSVFQICVQHTTLRIVSRRVDECRKRAWCTQ